MREKDKQASEKQKGPTVLTGPAAQTVHDRDAEESAEWHEFERMRKIKSGD